jgi:hypothetical protein
MVSDGGVVLWHAPPPSGCLVCDEPVVHHRVPIGLACEVAIPVLGSDVITVAGKEALVTEWKRQRVLLQSCLEQKLLTSA